ncbi:MAG: aminotransferase class IV [Gammaproteobacteria bacterium]|nr:aminotransferase class IV [Gammaproteobacteria bacterium]
MVRSIGYVNGVVTDLADARIPVLDRGFLYGDSVYEVFRTYCGIPFLFDEHFDRLLNSAKLAGMIIPYSREDIYAATHQAAMAAHADAGEDIYVRYQITRGVGPIDLNPEASQGSTLIVIVKAVPGRNPEHYDPGITLAVPELRRNSINSLNPNIKSGNYLNNIIALAEARKSGADDCLMLDAAEQVTECSNSNCWFVLDNKVVTPEDGNLNGLTRRTLIDLYGRAGIRVELRPVQYEELENATECFITSATREVMPVARLKLLDGRCLHFENGGGPRTRLAIGLYGEMVREFVQTHETSRWH